MYIYFESICYCYIVGKLYMKEVPVMEVKDNYK